MFEKLKKSKRIFIIPIVFIIVFGLLILPAFIPIVKANPENLPIGLVVSDEGEFGQNISGELPDKAPEAIKIITYDSVEDMETAMNEREIYGAIEFPKDFSSQIKSLQSAEPEKAVANIYVNEGANAMAATMVETALTNMVSMLNDQISNQMLTTIQEQADQIKNELAPVIESQDNDTPLAQLPAMISPIQPERVQDFAKPIEYEVTKVNETSDLANIPMAFLSLIWLISIVTAATLYLSNNSRSFTSKAKKLYFNLLQSVLPFVYALIAGYVLTWYGTWILDIHFESFNTVALYLTLVISAFILMIFAVMKWLKLPSIALFVILMFFSMASIQIVPEMMPNFYRDYLYSWLPLRIYADGFKEVLFFSKSLINDYSMILIWIIIGALVIIWLKNLLEKNKVKTI